jgi:tetratricopeptide (TPR) repeat protein
MEAIPLAPPAVQDAATFENPALRTIVGQADQAEAAGDLDRARASLERALKIDARNARLWLRLGELNLRAGDPAQALQTAERARELAGSDNALRGLATDLIERAQRAARPAG